MQQLRALPARQQSPRKVYVHSELSTCSHVFVRHDANRKPLQAPYDGPYKVLKRTEKYFTLDIKGKQETISLDRLKPAHLEYSSEQCRDTTTYSNPPNELVPDASVRVTRSGRHVHWPKRFLSTVH